MRQLLLIGLALLLISCASQPPHKIPTSVNELRFWSAEGKISIRYQDNTQSAYFQWRNQGEHYTIRLHGPFGQGAAILERDRHGVHLQSDNGKQTADSAETLLRNSLGWSFPISDMNWWVRGLASPNAPVEHLQKTDNDLVQQLQQLGWNIEYRKYQQIQQLTLPYKLVASRQNLTITLLLKQWQL